MGAKSGSRGSSDSNRPRGLGPAGGEWWKRAGLAAAAAAAGLAGGACSIESVIGVEPVADPAAAVAARAETEAAAPTTAVPGDGENEDDEISPLDITGEIVSQHDLVDGDCFNQVDSVRAGRKVTITSRLDCDQPHWAEVFHTFEVDAPHPAIYPGTRAMEDLARRGCYERFESFVGLIYELSVLRIGIFIPDRGNFEHPEARYRGIHCWLYHGEEETVEGSVRGLGI